MEPFIQSEFVGNFKPGLVASRDVVIERITPTIIVVFRRRGEGDCFETIICSGCHSSQVSNQTAVFNWRVYVANSAARDYCLCQVLRKFRIYNGRRNGRIHDVVL
jgi:hypothetical protein